jgi:hypothetical protein
MKHLVTILALLVAGAAAAEQQQVSEDEANAVSAIFTCLSAGLPNDWARARMIVELEQPGATTGNVRYLVSREGAGDKSEDLVPCDAAMPARMLIELRQSQAPDRRGWKGAQLEVLRNGAFRLNYDYPK